MGSVARRVDKVSVENLNPEDHFNNCAAPGFSHLSRLDCKCISSVLLWTVFSQTNIKPLTCLTMYADYLWLGLST